MSGMSGIEWGVARAAEPDRLYRGPMRETQAREWVRGWEATPGNITAGGGSMFVVICRQVGPWTVADADDPEPSVDDPDRDRTAEAGIEIGQVWLDRLCGARFKVLATYREPEMPTCFVEYEPRPDAPFRGKRTLLVGYFNTACERVDDPAVRTGVA
jgi:hypothetical protein